MVLKGMKSSLKKNCQKKHFCQKKILLKKTNSDKKNFSESFRSSCEKQWISCLDHIWSIGHLRLMQRLAWQISFSSDWNSFNLLIGFMIITICLCVFKIMEDGISTGCYRSVGERSNFEFTSFIDIQVTYSEEIPLVSLRVLSFNL